MDLEKLTRLAKQAKTREPVFYKSTKPDPYDRLWNECQPSVLLALISELTAAREVVEAAREVADDRLSLSDFEGKIMQIEEALERYDKVKSC